MSPPAAATRLLPSAEEATNNDWDIAFVNQFDAQVYPPSADVYIEPVEFPTASLFPSDEEVRDVQAVITEFDCGTLLDVQVAPEVVEIKTELSAVVALAGAAASLLPSADEATGPKDSATREGFPITPEFVQV